MAYNKTTWQTGDIVTSEKLNNIENGIANAGPLVVHVTMEEVDGDDLFVLDKTWAEINATQGNVIFIETTPEGWNLMSGVGVYASADNEPYSVQFVYLTELIVLTADTENDYPRGGGIK